MRNLAFHSLYERRSETECWPWLGPICSEKEIGIYISGGKRIPAHRIMWEDAHGCRPDGPVRHTCDMRDCVNPGHLYIGEDPEATRKITDLFWGQVRKSPSCWLWTGPIKEHGGYGYFHAGSRTMLAHRYAWEEAYGHLDNQLRHICKNKNCVRIEHLEIKKIG